MLKMPKRRACLAALLLATTGAAVPPAGKGTISEKGMGGEKDCA